MRPPTTITPPEGKLAVFLPGLGAVATTFITGCLLARAGHSPPIGSLTQMGTVRLGKRTEDRVPRIADHFEWNDLRFEIVDMDGNRIDRVLVVPRRPSTDEPPAGQAL